MEGVRKFAYLADQDDLDNPNHYDIGQLTDDEMIEMLSGAAFDSEAAKTNRGAQSAGGAGSRSNPADTDGEPPAKRARLEGDPQDQFRQAHDQFNLVGPNTNLSYQNVAYLLRASLIDNFTARYPKKTKQQIEAEVDLIVDAKIVITAISNQENPEIDKGLRDEILKFIAREPAQEYITILLCTGSKGPHGEIVGDGHWTALHLRKVESQIWSYHMNSSGSLIPPAVNRVINGIPLLTPEQLSEKITVKQSDGTLQEVIGLNDSNKRALGRIPFISFGEVVDFGSSQQKNAHDCGLFAVFNGINLSCDNLEELFAISERTTPEKMQQFIDGSRQKLMQHFGQVLTKPAATKKKTTSTEAKQKVMEALRHYANSVRSEEKANGQAPSDPSNIIIDLLRGIEEDIHREEDERCEEEVRCAMAEQDQKINEGIKQIIDSKNNPIDKISGLYDFVLQKIEGLDPEILEDPNALADFIEVISHKCFEPYKKLIEQILPAQEMSADICSPEEMQLLILVLKDSNIITKGSDNIKKELSLTTSDHNQKTSFFESLKAFSENKNRDNFCKLYSVVQFLSQDSRMAPKFSPDIKVEHISNAFITIRDEPQALARDKDRGSSHS